MALFVRLTLLVAAALLAVVVLGFLLHLVLVAAIVAAVGLGGLVAVRAVRRSVGRRRVTTLTARR